MKVLAAVHERPEAGQVVERIDLDPPARDEVLVRVAASGICRSDLSLIDGKWPVPTPIVLGHEGAGVIEAVGPGVPGERVGEHVVLTFARVVTLQTPVVIPQPSRHARPRSRRGSIAIAAVAGTTASSANDDTTARWWTRSPARERRVVPSSSVPVS